MSTSVKAVIASIVVGGLLLWTGIMLLKGTSRPSTPSPPALPAAQVMAARHSPLRDHDPERERRASRVVMKVVGVGCILAALVVFLVGLALAGPGY